MSPHIKRAFKKSGKHLRHATKKSSTHIKKGFTHKFAKPVAGGIKTTASKVKSGAVRAEKAVERKVISPIGKKLENVADFTGDKITQLTDSATGAVDKISSALGSPVMLLLIGGVVVVVMMNR